MDVCINVAPATFTLSFINPQITAWTQIRINTPIYASTHGANAIVTLGAGITQGSVI